MQLDAEALYRVLCLSLDSCKDERDKAEAALKGADKSQGFLAALLAVAVQPQAADSARQAAAIQLKLQVRRWWAPLGDSYGQGYGEADKGPFRDNLIGAIAAAFSAPQVQAQLVEVFRLVSASDFPASWPGMLPSILELLGSGTTAGVQSGLTLARKVLKQMEDYPTSRRGDLHSVVGALFPPLRQMAPDLLQAATRGGEHSDDAFLIVKLIVKCLYSAVYKEVGPEVEQHIQAWMAFLLGAVALPLSHAGGEAAPAAKCRKWVFLVFHRFCTRHGHGKRCVNGAEEFARGWCEAFAAPVLEAALREACCHSARLGGPGGADAWSPRPSAALAMSCLGALCERDDLYAVLRPQLQVLLEDGIFRWARFGPDDERLWGEDPEEFIRMSFDDFTHFRDPRGSSLDLVQKLVSHQKTDVLAPLVAYCRLHLEAQASNPASPEMCANKDGALLILGTLRDDVCPKAKKAKKGKAAAAPAPGTVNVEELLSTHVRPDLGSPNPFLRLRACWVYEQFAARSARFGPAGAATDLLTGVLRLLEDPEMPVRVRAATCTKALIKRKSDVEVHGAVSTSIGPLLERLLKVAAEVQCEEVAEAVETLAEAFQQEIVPYAGQLVAHLAAQVCSVADTQDAGASANTGDDDNDLHGDRAAGALTTILGVLEACAGSGSGADGAKQNSQMLFAAMGESLLPLLARVLSPTGVDYLTEGIDILEMLLLNGPSPVPEHMWRVFPRLYQLVCGHSVPSMPLEGHAANGWAPDYLANLRPVVEVFICRGPHAAFMAGCWTDAELPYPEMVLRMCSKVLNMTGYGSETDCASAARISACVFLAAPQSAASLWLPRFFLEHCNRLSTTETAELRKAIFHAFGAMMLHDTALFLRCLEEKGCTQDVMRQWLQEAGLPRSLRDRKVFILALTGLLRVSCSEGGAAVIPPAVAAVMPHVVQQLGAQSREIVRLRVRKCARKEADGDDSDDDDDDDDLEDEDALEAALNKIRNTPDDDSGAEYSDDEDDEDEEAFPCANLSAVDELAVLASCLRQAPPQAQEQLEKWVGSPLAPWLSALDSEVQRTGELCAMGQNDRCG